MKSVAAVNARRTEQAARPIQDGSGSSVLELPSATSADASSVEFQQLVAGVRRALECFSMSHSHAHATIICALEEERYDAAQAALDVLCDSTSSVTLRVAKIKFARALSASAPHRPVAN